MRKVKAKSVDLIVTSPPYWDVKDYKTKDQVGFKEPYSEYLSRISKIFKECYRTLKDDRFFIVNINTITRKKKLIPIPLDFIEICKTFNLNLIEIVYWHKSSAIPSKFKFSDHFEYFLIFTKGNGRLLENKTFNTYKTNLKLNKPNIWKINKKFGNIGKKYMSHPALFPIEYIENLISIFTKPEEIVLDPFLGAATTLIAADRRNRSSIGFEINSSFKELINIRCIDEKVINNIEFIA